VPGLAGGPKKKGPRGHGKARPSRGPREEKGWHDHARPDGCLDTSFTGPGAGPPGQGRTSRADRTSISVPNRSERSQTARTLRRPAGRKQRRQAKGGLEQKGRGDPADLRLRKKKDVPRKAITKKKNDLSCCLRVEVSRDLPVARDRPHRRGVPCPEMNRGHRTGWAAAKDCTPSWNKRPGPGERPVRRTRKPRRGRRSRRPTKPACRRKRGRGSQRLGRAGSWRREQRPVGGEPDRNWPSYREAARLESFLDPTKNLRLRRQSEEDLPCTRSRPPLARKGAPRPADRKKADGVSPAKMARPPGSPREGRFFLSLFELRGGRWRVQKAPPCRVG